MTLNIIILAAGQGKRMQSELPKVLHSLGGKTLLEHVTHTAYKLCGQQPPIIIYGHQGEKIRHALAHLNVTWVEQLEQLGTGHAVKQALPMLSDDAQVLILNGDVPLISENTLKHLLTQTAKNALGIITANVSNPAGYGRIMRDSQNQIIKIIEEKDSTKEQHAINEINTGIYLVPEKHLKKWLVNLRNENAQKEFYLTEIIPMAINDRITIQSIQPARNEEILGINDRIQLAEVERIHQRRQVEKWMAAGVTFLDPARVDIRGEVFIGKDVTIDINVILEGSVKIGNHTTIGAHSIIRNTVIGDHVEIKSHSVIDGAEIKNHCVIGPFARVRPGTELAAHTHIGNFVEIKNSFIDEYTKVNHLSYIGDCDIGKHVNVGAGTITCNYDGVNKHKTIIGNHAFIGSNTALVAPVSVGEYATIGAGSTITTNTPPNQLTLARARQTSFADWQRPQKKGE